MLIMIEFFSLNIITLRSGSNLEAIEKLTAWRGKKSKLLLEEQTVADECMERMHELKEIRLSNERKIRELGQLYSKPVRKIFKYHHQVQIIHFIYFQSI